MQFVNLYRQYQAYQYEIDQAIKKVLLKGDYIFGEDVTAFENELQQYFAVNNIITCANGTDALLLALLTLDLKQNDEIIVPDFTFIATASQICFTPAKPVFVDVDINTYNLTADLIEKRITKKTKAVIIVHLFGKPCPMKEITALCKKNNIVLIEDCAQCFGSKYQNQFLGCFGDMATFSFFPAKNLGAYGDGGMIICQDNEKAKKIKQLRFHGHVEKYHSQYIGINSRLDTLQAAILRIKLKNINEEIIQRRKVANYYHQNLKNDLIINKPQEDLEDYHSYNYYSLRVKKRNELQKYLMEKNIPSMVYYPRACHQQEAFNKNQNYDDTKFINSSRLTQEILSLPIDAFITPSEQNKIIDRINHFNC